MKTLGRITKTLGAVALTLLTVTAVHAAKPAKSLLTPDNHTLILIDHQPQMAFATQSHDIAEIRNNVTGLAKAAKLFEVPAIFHSCRRSEEHTSELQSRPHLVCRL